MEYQTILQFLIKIMFLYLAMLEQIKVWISYKLCHQREQTELNHESNYTRWQVLYYIKITKTETNQIQVIIPHHHEIHMLKLRSAPKTYQTKTRKTDYYIKNALTLSTNRVPAVQVDVANHLTNLVISPLDSIITRLQSRWEWDLAVQHRVCEPEHHESR